MVYGTWGLEDRKRETYQSLLGMPANGMESRSNRDGWLSWSSVFHELGRLWRWSDLWSLKKKGSFARAILQMPSLVLSMHLHGPAVKGLGE